ncbi:sulfatase-like hydrolase/transferase [uncultured Lutibacter sp.]|uniref:sulfatase-like hydrolase/transferase n=1 Tax=uncultured Lutibacter sp. TaxID=437739 RepID=UPI002619ACB4|nr:sulfatase-like hydrolase/transferase [uncultured Lutibacter sp.]
MKTIKTTLIILSFLFVGKAIAQQPNVLYILTDDHRYDAVRSFNKMITGNEMSELGYVESPEIDKLAEMGTTFINTYCQAQGCAPSRASMHYGRYPFRSGIYEFEYHNNTLEHSKPTLPEQMVKLGYQTFHVGKLGVRIKTLKDGKTKPYAIYQTDIDFRTLARENLTAWGSDWLKEVNGNKLKTPKNYSFIVNDNGEREYISTEIEDMGFQKKGTAEATVKKYDLLRKIKGKKKATFDMGMIIGGVSARKAGKTRDGYYTSVFQDYLNNADKPFSVGSLTYKGINSSKPVFCHIGYDFPHTPVLPPADYRERFKQHKYKVPELSDEEYTAMAKQMKKVVDRNFTNNYSDKDKQTMIQDYFAFCAYGDKLIGDAVDTFIKYSESNKQEWMVIYVHGDHGWKLNEHGAISKFTPWDIDSHNPIVVVSSDKNKFPAGKVVSDFTEFVDIAPTALAAAGAKLKNEEFSYLDGLDLAKVVQGKGPVRDYVIGESHAVTGPRAFIRTNEYVFSIQTRPNTKHGDNMKWALNANYKDLDPALYHITNDPQEINNVAFDKKYKSIAKAMKEKLLNIVLGDNRVEVEWEKWGSGTKAFHSNFAPGSHDFKLKLPK